MRVPFRLLSKKFLYNHLWPRFATAEPAFLASRLARILRLRTQYKYKATGSLLLSESGVLASVQLKYAPFLSPTPNHHQHYISPSCTAPIK